MLRTATTMPLGCLILFALAATARAEDTPPGPAEIFDQRIMPIFRSPQPSSCVQCHLAAVDLKNYILSSSERTFVALRDQGLVDTKHPEKSKILTLIRMGDKDLDEGARMIHAEMRQAEFEAFASWIKACCEDKTLLALPKSTSAEQFGPTKPVEVVRHARKSRLVDSFARNVWSQRMRCFPCHTPYEIDSSNPRQQAAIKKQKEFEEKYGEALVARLKIFKETPEATLRYLIETSRETHGDQLPLVNIEDPLQSLLLLKPLSKLPKKISEGEFAEPSSTAPVTHMGGLKLHKNDQSYKSFVAWLTDYAKVCRDEYTSVGDLPDDNWHASDLWLRVKDLPEEWEKGTPVQLHVHAWDEAGDQWSLEPVAFTQSVVTPRRFVNGTLFLIANHQATASLQVEKNRLRKRKYLARCYVDADGILARDPTILLRKQDFRGEVELSKPRWRPTFRRAEVASAKNLVTAP